VTRVLALGRISTRSYPAHRGAMLFTSLRVGACYCGTAITFTPFISSFCRTSGDATAVSGTVSLPLARLSERLK
jgi:hypothetical protein